MTDKNSQQQPDDTVQPHADTFPVRISVRTLAETVHRRGGLAAPLYGGVSATDGIRLHQRCIRELELTHAGCAVQAEVTLQTTEAVDGFALQIAGRCDALAEDSLKARLYEVKSFAGSPEHLPPEGEPLHWAQAKLYGWLYLKNRPDMPDLELSVVYISEEQPELLYHNMTYRRHDLETFYLETCRRYIRFAADILRGEQARRQSGLDVRFPYPDLRSGQKRFMNEVVGTVRQTGTAFISAPTGIGKTMAALYPAVKVLANRLADHAFYLTNMTSARLVAARAMDDLHRAGLMMKSLILYAKEKLCLMPELYCDTSRCPFALFYYDHLPDALRRLFLHEQIGETEILECARKNQVCPFELALDMAVYCEVIICDYNYAFDPRVRLDRFFNQDKQKQLLLVDEAHNLPERSRSMHSAELDEDVLLQALQAIQHRSAALENDLRQVLDWFWQMKTDIEAGLSAFPRLEPSVRDQAVMQDGPFRAMRDLPLDLLARIARFNARCHLYLESNRSFDGRLILLKGYFQLLFFNRVAEQFFDEAYVTIARLMPAKTVSVTLMCLDAAARLSASYMNRHPAVFFSATLSPIDYYTGLLHGRNPPQRAETLQLGSPFPSENLLVLVCSTLSTRYRQRQETVSAILDLILTAVRQKTGNYLVFVPSHAYLHMVRTVLRNRPGRDDFDYLFQIREMNEQMRRKYLSRFDHFGSRTLLAFAVMGGVFAEGIDLYGEKLAGVAVVGVGLPQICPEREIMRQYYAQALGSGYEYAYLFPGFNKVQQAAGRVIRSENDRGFILLVDDRYDQPVYRSLFPVEWQPHNVAAADDIAVMLQDFWGVQAPRG